MLTPTTDRGPIPSFQKPVFFTGSAYAEANYARLQKTSKPTYFNPRVFLHESISGTDLEPGFSFSREYMNDLPERLQGVIFRQNGDSLYATYSLYELSDMDKPPGQRRTKAHSWWRKNVTVAEFVRGTVGLIVSQARLNDLTDRSLMSDPGQQLLVKPSVSPTHDVTNQTPSLENYNLYGVDTVLQEALRREGAAWIENRANEFGAFLGRPETIELGFDANATRNIPEFTPRDRTGHRIDEVKFHPAYHRLMDIAKKAGLHSLSWTDERDGSHVARAALFYLFCQIEQGVSCPISMTHAGISVLKGQGNHFKALLGKLTPNDYEPELRYFEEKNAINMGMAMTEKQGGSDVRSNSTRAVPVDDGGTGNAYRLTGHKWFCSAPMSDVFLTLAQTKNGLSCFLVPRILADGTRNNFEIQQLKEKLGDRSNASSEIEYNNTVGYLVGEEGRGVPTIIQMVNHTRLDCTVSSAAMMRQALTQLLHHTQYREAFGDKLINQPLMKNVLADLAIETEASTLLGMRLARAFDDAADQTPGNREYREQQARFARIGTAIGKYWVCKRAASGMIAEALEGHGGNGFVEESMMPRLYRQAPVNSLWEGSGNVMVLDVLRAMKNPENVAAFLSEINKTVGKDPRYDRFVRDLLSELKDTSNIELRARRVVEQMALALEGALVLEHSPDAVKEAFMASRIAGDSGLSYGTLPPHIDFDAIIERAQGSLAQTSKTS